MTARWIWLVGTLVGLTLAVLVVLWPSDDREALDTTAAEGVWLQEPDAAFALAAAEDKPLVIVFRADWCPVSHEMERTTFQDAEVVDRLGSVVPLKADVDEQQDLADRFGAMVLPTTVVLTPTGEVVTSRVGYLNPPQFLALLPKPDGAPRAP